MEPPSTVDTSSSLTTSGSNNYRLALKEIIEKAGALYNVELTASEPLGSPDSFMPELAQYGVGMSLR